MSRSSLRRKIEKKLQCVAQKEVELSNEFPDTSECKRNTMVYFMCQCAVINGLYFEQLWCSYIICVKQSKKS